MDDDLVVSSHGVELQRITRDDFNERLTPAQLEDVARIEKSMEINLAAWKRLYPTRAVNAADHELFVRVKDALVEDLDGVSRLLFAGGCTSTTTTSLFAKRSVRAHEGGL